MDFTGQTDDLACVPQATATADFNTPAPLSFRHRLAKVRVVPTGDKAGEATAVNMYGCPTAAIGKGPCHPRPARQPVSHV